MTSVGLCLALGIAPAGSASPEFSTDGGSASLTPAFSDTSPVDIFLQTKPQTIFLNFTRTDIGVVLQALAKLADVNIVPDRDVTGPVDI
ncbi:hypothetical protein HY522_04205, partial [bacterium]|nr:hypothetical protein [bacterium]